MKTTTTLDLDLVCVADVADMAEIAPSTVVKHIARGTIPPPARVGHMHVWLRADIEEWVETRRRRGRPPINVASERYAVMNK